MFLLPTRGLSPQPDCGNKRIAEKTRKPRKEKHREKSLDTKNNTNNPSVLILGISRFPLLFLLLLPVKGYPLLEFPLLYYTIPAFPIPLRLTSAFVLHG